MGASELPECVARLLWDTDASAVSWEAQRDSLIGRILAHGDLEAIRWVRAQAGDEELRAWIVANRARRLSRQQIRFWHLLLELPEELVETWLRMPERQVWDNRCAGTWT